MHVEGEGVACVRGGHVGERRDHAAQGRAEQVGPVLGKWHRAGSACIARVRLAAQVRLVRGEGGSFAAQITGLQRVSR